MGCDIHATIEERPHGSWWGKCKDYNIDRSYILFAMLADVRNGYGVTAIAEPRGVPEDASFEFKEEVEEWDSDAHTKSWLTFRELREYAEKVLPYKFDSGEEYDYRELDFYQTMKLVADRIGEDNVRICFFFDN